MTLRHLMIFKTVYETLSFTKAGQQLHIAQPSISLAIRQLEETYHVVLFDRIKHGIYPTTHGEKLYDYVTHILALYDEMEASMKEKNILATLRIGASITIGNMVLPSLLQQFSMLYPDTKLDVIIHNSKHLEACLLKNKIDLALLETSPQNEKITCIPFLQDHLCTIAHPSHPLSKQKAISIQQLCEEPFFMREEGSSVRSLIDSIFLTQHITLKPAWVSSSTRALVHAVEHNLGITTLPYQLVKEEIKDHKVCVLDVKDCQIKRFYNIVYYQTKYLSNVMKTFITFCETYQQKNL